MESLSILAARSIAASLRSALPIFNQVEEPLYSYEDIKSSILRRSTLTPQFFDVLAALEPHLALAIHNELIYTGDDIGTVLSLILRSLDTFNAVIYDPASIKSTADVVSAFALVAHCAPPNLTQMTFSDLSQSPIVDLNYVRQLSQSECAPTLQPLSITASSIAEDDDISYFSKFTSLTELNLSCCPHQESFRKLILQLPKIVKFSYPGLLPFHWSLSQTLRDILGPSKDEFTLPHLEVLEISLSLEESDMEWLVNHLKDHKTATQLRRLPICSNFYSQENEALVKQALQLMPSLESFGTTLSWKTIQELIPMALFLRRISISSSYKGEDFREFESLRHEHVDFLVCHVSFLEELMIFPTLESHVDMTGLSHLTKLQMEQFNPCSSNEPNKLDIIFPASLQQFKLNTTQPCDISLLGPSLQRLGALSDLSLVGACVALDQVPQFCRSLPRSLKRLKLESFVREYAAHLSSQAPVIISFDIPCLQELILGDAALCEDNIFVEFVCAPRLVGLSVLGTPQQYAHTLQSLARFPSCHQTLRSLDLKYTEDHDNEVSLSDQTFLAQSLSKFTHLRSLMLGQSINIKNIVELVTPKLQRLTTLSIASRSIEDEDVIQILSHEPWLTSFDLMGTERVTGLWWLQHKRLQNFRFSPFILAASQNNKRDSLNAVTILSSERVPRLKQILVDARKLAPGAIKPAKFVVCGLQDMFNCELARVDQVKALDNPKLNRLVVYFEGNNSSLKFQNVESLSSIELSVKDMSTAPMKVEVIGELPQLLSASFKIAPKTALANSVILDLIRHCPTVRTLLITQLGVKAELEQLWAAQPSLETIVFNYSTRIRPV